MTTRSARPRRHSAIASEDVRGILSHQERRGGRRALLLILQGSLLLCLLVASLGPLAWLAKASVSTSQDTLREPFALWPSGIHLQNLADAWVGIDLGRYLVNTTLLAVGNWGAALLVATTGGYVLAVLRPRYGKVISFGVLATLFIPGVASLVTRYLTVLDLPLLHVSLVNTFWAVWLPAGANAFNVLLVTRFYDQLPKELFDAARVDGAGPLRMFVHIVLPLSRPVIGVVSLLTLVASWKEFLWPLLVLPDPQLQPLSVALTALAKHSELSQLLAALFVTAAVPLLIFAVFHRQFLRSAGSAGAMKG